MALNPNWKPRFPGDQPPQDNFRMTTTVDPYPQHPTRSGNTGITGIPPGSPAGTQPPWVKNRGVPGKDFIHIRPPGGYGPKSPNNIPPEVLTAWNNFKNPPADTGGFKPTREMVALFEQYGLNDSTPTPVKGGAGGLPGSSNGYGSYLNLPPGAIVKKDWIDKDKDGVDDRYQTGPGQPRGGGKGGGKPTKPPRPTRPTAPIKPSPIRPPAPYSGPTTPLGEPINWKSKKKRRQAMPVTPLGYLASNNLGASGMSAQ